MRNLFHGSVHDEHPTEHKNAGGKVHAALKHAGPIHDKERFGHRINQADHREKQHDAQGHSNDDAPIAHRFLLRDGRALALDGDIEKVIET